MGTWHRFTVTMDPLSYYRLLMRQEVLATTNPDASISTAARFTLRRLSFQPEHKAAYVRAAQRLRGVDRPRSLRDRRFVEAMAEELDQLEADDSG